MTFCPNIFSLYSKSTVEYNFHFFTKNHKSCLQLCIFFLQPKKSRSGHRFLKLSKGFTSRIFPTIPCFQIWQVYSFSYLKGVSDVAKYLLRSFLVNHYLIYSPKEACYLTYIFFAPYVWAKITYSSEQIPKRKKMCLLLKYLLHALLLLQLLTIGDQ